MASPDETINGLRDAIRISPENLPLRQALAEILMSFGRYEEAEREYRQMLVMAPQDVTVKVALATVYYQQE